MYYVYVLKSIKDESLYIGYSSNLKLRLKEHFDGLVTATKDRRPLKLVYYECGLSKEKAILREKSLKTGFGRNYLKNRIAQVVLI